MTFLFDCHWKENKTNYLMQRLINLHNKLSFLTISVVLKGVQGWAAGAGVSYRAETRKTRIDLHYNSETQSFYFLLSECVIFNLKFNFPTLLQIENVKE